MAEDLSPVAISTCFAVNRVIVTALCSDNSIWIFDGDSWKMLPRIVIASSSRE